MEELVAYLQKTTLRDHNRDKGIQGTMFTVGQEYSRIDLLDYMGSRQAQSGIIWGYKQPDCIICTSGGKHSKSAGYQDERFDDGSWIYFGQGAAGNHDEKTFANKILASDEKTILLFTIRV